MQNFQTRVNPKRLPKKPSEDRTSLKNNLSVTTIFFIFRVKHQKIVFVIFKLKIRHFVLMSQIYDFHLGNLDP